MKKIKKEAMNCDKNQKNELNQKKKKSGKRNGSGKYMKGKRREKSLEVRHSYNPWML